MWQHIVINVQRRRRRRPQVEFSFLLDTVDIVVDLSLQPRCALEMRRAEREQMHVA